MMTTYDLIRTLLRIDPDGSAPVMLSMTVMKGDREVEANSFIEDVFVERPDGVTLLVLTGNANEE